MALSPTTSGRRDDIELLRVLACAAVMLLHALLIFSPEPLYHLPESASVVGSDEQGALRAAIQGKSAYLKIADGCRRPCAFCAIPLPSSLRNANHTPS